MMVYLLAAAMALAAPLSSVPSFSTVAPAPQCVRATPSRQPAEADGQRPLSIGIEASYNGLVGIGGVVGYTLDPHFTVEGGAGYSQAGLKLGTRLRYNLLDGAFTPFAALSFSVASGTWGNTVEVMDTKDEMPAHFRVSVSPYGQAVVGLRQRIDRFEVSGMVGWSQLLREKNIAWAAAPTNFQKRTYPGQVNSGLVLALNVSCGF